MENIAEIQALQVISVNAWHILIALCNLLIMFLILKHFLFKPVMKMLADRKEQVDKVYRDAEDARADANGMKKEYEERMASAREEADNIVRTAVDTAQRKGDSIVFEASSQASHIKKKAEEEIAREKQQMLQDVKGEISDLAVSIASKVVEREIDQKDYDSFVDDFIRNVGDKA